MDVPVFSWTRWTLWGAAVVAAVAVAIAVLVGAPAWAVAVLVVPAAGIGLVVGLLAGAVFTPSRPPDPSPARAAAQEQQQLQIAALRSQVAELDLAEVERRFQHFDTKARALRSPDRETLERAVVPAGAWRKLARTMRQRGALTVGDLGADAVARWAVRLGYMERSAADVTGAPRRVSR